MAILIATSTEYWQLIRLFQSYSTRRWINYSVIAGPQWASTKCPQQARPYDTDLLLNFMLAF